MKNSKINSVALNKAVIGIANIVDLSPFAIKQRLERALEFGVDMEKVSAEKLKNIFHDHYQDELQYEAEELGTATSVSSELIPLNEAIDALTEKYLTEFNVNKRHAISMLLETELLSQDIDKSEVTFSKACKIWFDKCENTFIHMYVPRPPSSPASALAA